MVNGMLQRCDHVLDQDFVAIDANVAGAWTSSLFPNGIFTVYVVSSVPWHGGQVVTNSSATVACLFNTDPKQLGAANPPHLQPYWSFLLPCFVLHTHTCQHVRFQSQATKTVVFSVAETACLHTKPIALLSARPVSSSITANALLSAALPVAGPVALTDGGTCHGRSGPHAGQPATGQPRPHPCTCCMRSLPSSAC